MTKWLDKWNMDGKTSIIWFILFAALLIFFVIKLVKNADVLISKTKFGGGIIGGILIATISAAPEFITSIEQSLLGYPGAASSDNIGANAITGFLIALGALLFIRETFLNRLKKWTIITLWISFVISLFITIMMYLQTDISLGVKGKFVIGLVPLSLLIMYFILLMLQIKFGNKDEHHIENDYIKKTSSKLAAWKFFMWSTLIIMTSIIINEIILSVEHGYAIKEESAGGFFLAVTMAMPEGIAFFAMLKRKQFTTAVAILIGHGFALFVSEWLGDAAYIHAPIYSTIQVHLVWPISVITTISFGLLGIASLLGKKSKILKKNKIVYSIIPTSILLTYILGWILIITMFY